MREFIGIPYKLGGKLPDGLDCYGIVKHFSKIYLKRTLPEYFYNIEDFSPEVSALTIAKGLSKNWVKVSVPLAGDVLIIRLNGSPSHCGIVIDDENFLHTLKGRESCIERITNWKNLIVGVYRWQDY